MNFLRHAVTAAIAFALPYSALGGQVTVVNPGGIGAILAPIIMPPSTPVPVVSPTTPGPVTPPYAIPDFAQPIAPPATLPEGDQLGLTVATPRTLSPRQQVLATTLSHADLSQQSTEDLQVARLLMGRALSDGLLPKDLLTLLDAEQRRLEAELSQR